MLDRNNSVPLYLQVKQWILNQIDSGEWKEGDLITPERVLASDFGVHRLTIRQALTELVSEGRVVRIRGRGTFVSSAIIQQSSGRLTSFSQDIKMLGMVPNSKVLKMEIREATQLEREKLSLSDGELVLELHRLRLADNISMGLEMAVLPYRLCKELTQLPLNEFGSLYSALKNLCGIELHRAEQTIQAGLPNANVARLLQIKEGVPIIHSTRRTYSSTGTPVEWVTSFYRGDRYTFQVELSL